MKFYLRSLVSSKIICYQSCQSQVKLIFGMDVLLADHFLSFNKQKKLCM